MSKTGLLCTHDGVHQAGIPATTYMLQILSRAYNFNLLLTPDMLWVFPDRRITPSLSRGQVHLSLAFETRVRVTTGSDGHQVCGLDYRHKPLQPIRQIER